MYLASLIIMLHANDMQNYEARLFDVNIGFHCPGWTWTLIMTSNRALIVTGGASFAIIAAHTFKS